MKSALLCEVVSALLIGCQDETAGRLPAHDNVSAPTGAVSPAGQLVYVPVYSHIYYRSAQRQMKLTATLSSRNVDLEDSVRVHQVDYYDSEGALVRRYLTEPVSIGPLSSRAYVIEEEDTRGGVGANFIVECEGDVQAPMIQAVRITTASTQGISFVAEGIPIEAIP